MHVRREIIIMHKSQILDFLILYFFVNTNEYETMSMDTGKEQPKIKRN